ncbi:uncharacterized protein LOC128207983 [Mya arenaria]|uniref:uncharacterized protein LOC128207983 n=1 Tax=Mya arenaria TaxID=6604 RepID=UPI0022E56174|nr:uncharacterized protein LOC128207983 [Mya arenaria]
MSRYKETAGISIRCFVEETLTVTVLLMNLNGPAPANGPDDNGRPAPDRRRVEFSNIVNEKKPNVVFLQEFSLKNIRGAKWKNYPLPEKYKKIGDKEACILYDSNLFHDPDDLDDTDFTQTNIRNILSELRRTSNNNLGEPFQTDFTPFPRMCLTILKTKTYPTLKFICISWHGWYSKMSVDKRSQFFAYLLEFLRQFKEKYNLPMLIAGDFNVKIEEIEDLVVPPFKLCKYEPSERREKRVIDFYIITDELDLG